MVLQTPSQALRHGRSLIRELAARHRTANPRVFGSVVTGQDREGSDLDVLVEPLPETTLFDLGGLQDALEEALGVRVDVKTPMDLPPHIRAEVLRQAAAGADLDSVITAWSERGGWQVVDAPAGIRTTLELPLIIGPGLRPF